MSAESSLDGSLNDTSSSGADPEIMFAPSPERGSGNHGIGLDETLPRFRNDAAVKTVNEGEYYSSVPSDVEYDVGDSHETEQSRSGILKRLGMVDSIPHCNKISSMLSDMGYPSIQIVSSDIDQSTRFV